MTTLTCYVIFRGTKMQDKDIFLLAIEHHAIMQLAGRFMSKINTKSGIFGENGDYPTECWIWTDTPNTDGYGVFSIDNKNTGAHRIAYKVFNGPLIDGYEIDHLCRRRDCVCPDHLEQITGPENVRRGKSGEYNRIKTHCHKGHEFTTENTYVYIRDGLIERQCRTCKRETQIAYRKRKHEL